MKKIIASVGLVAAGAASVQAQYAPGLTSQEMTKPWSLSASLRGFYDDNYLTLPANYANGTGGYSHPLSSYGTEVTPSASINHTTEDTVITASYIYDLKYFGNQDYTEQSHQLNLRFEHQFSERLKMSVGETCVIAQEPTMIDSSELVSTPLVANGNNVHNTGKVDLTWELTKQLDVHVGGSTDLYAYRQVGGDENPPYSYASRSASLDRIDSLGMVDLRWKALEDTTGVFGYQYGHTGYTEPSAPNGFLANSRNSDQDFVYLGADHSFTPDLNGSIRAGGEYIDYNKLPSPPGHTSKVSPYVDISVTDQYLPKSTVQVGVKHVHSATDVVGALGTGSPVLDSDTTAAYFSLNHSVSDKLTVSVLGQAQFSTFNGGGVGYNGKGEDFFIAGLNAAYQFNPFLLAEAGYNYSKLNSDLPDRGYTRNYLYIGVRATY